MSGPSPRGFTLIETLIVVAIIGILTTIVYPSYQYATRKTRRAEGRAALMQLMQQEERYYSHSTTYIPFSFASTEPEEKKFKWYSGESAKLSAYEISAKACEGGTIQQCVLLTARPGTAKVNASFNDKGCGDLMLTSTGIKTASGTAKDCWK
jgi:type IV pilus assembly protein PilE